MDPATVATAVKISAVVIKILRGETKCGVTWDGIREKQQRDFDRGRQAIRATRLNRLEDGLVVVGALRYRIGEEPRGMRVTWPTWPGTNIALADWAFKHLTGQSVPIGERDRARRLDRNLAGLNVNARGALDELAAARNTPPFYEAYRAMLSERLGFEITPSDAELVYREWWRLCGLALDAGAVGEEAREYASERIGRELERIPDTTAPGTVLETLEELREADRQEREDLANRVGGNASPAVSIDRPAYAVGGLLLAVGLAVLLLRGRG